MENKSFDGVDLSSLLLEDTSFVQTHQLSPHPHDSSRWTEWKVAVDGRTSVDPLEVRLKH